MELLHGRILRGDGLRGRAVIRSGLHGRIRKAGEVRPGPGPEPQPIEGAYLTFSSPSAFTLAVANATKNWDGTLEYSMDAQMWSIWDGTNALSSVDGKLYLRGTNNTHISAQEYDTLFQPGGFILEHADSVHAGDVDIDCFGNIESLLDWQTVADGRHPNIGDNAFQLLFAFCESLATPPSLGMLSIPSFGCHGLFMDTGITSIPQIIATDLGYDACAFLFSNCPNIKVSETETAEYKNAYVLPVKHNAMLGYYDGMFEHTGGTFTGTPANKTIYYTSNTAIRAIESTTLSMTITSELTQDFYFTQSAPAGVEIDWGDGSTKESTNDLSAHVSHTWAEAGVYRVLFTAKDGVTWSPGATIIEGDQSNNYGILGRWSKSATHPQLTGFSFGFGCYLDVHGGLNGCTSLTSIQFPSWISSIAEYCFSACTGLASVAIPSTITNIGECALLNCTSIEEVRIPHNVQELKSGVFAGCGAIKNVEIASPAVADAAFWSAENNAVPGPIEKIWIRSTCLSLPEYDGSLTSGAFCACPVDTEASPAVATFTIYAEARTKPDGWGEGFSFADVYNNTPIYAPVIYGQTRRPW